MDFEKIRENVPAEEQQRYIALSMNIDQLNRKERLSDEEYQRMYEEVSRTGDQQQIDQFVNDHISQSEYDEKMDIFETQINEINSRYGIEQESLNLEFEEEASLKKENLRALQEYYRVNDINMMRDVIVENLSNESAIEMYNGIVAGIDSERLEEMLNQGREAIKTDAKVRRRELKELQAYYRLNGNNEIVDTNIDLLNDREAINLHNDVTSSINSEDLTYILNQGREIIDQGRLQPIRDRLTKKGISSTDGGSDGNGSSTDDVDSAIEEFKEHSEEIREQLNEIKRSLVLDDTNDLDVTDAIRGLTSELGELSRAADDLLELMDASKTLNENAIFSMTPAEIKETIKGFKERLKEIKQHQIDKYNARVDATNKILEELRNVEGLENIPENISRCEADVTDWRNIKYLEQIDYNKLVKVNKRIAEINKSRGQGTDTTDPVDLEVDMVAIENEITAIDSEIKDEMSLEDIEKVKQDINRVVNRIVDFKTKLEKNRSKISEEEYNDYLGRINDAEANLADMYNRLPVKNINNDYKQLLERLEELNAVSTYCSNMIESLYGHLDEKGVQAFIEHIGTYEGRLQEIKQEIEEKHKAGNLDENQYNELMKKAEEIENILKNAREKVKQPEMIKDVDVFAFLNKKIDGIENALDELEKQVDALEKPIKDKNVRKQIDAIIKKLEDEVKDIENTLEKYKDEDPEKYKETKEKLDKVKERLDKVGKNYRKKCPLLIRAVKSAKAFYKKHKKACLIIAGLAAFALVGYHVIIPAIMHGNIMMGTAAPWLSGFTNFVNNILGGIVGASKTVNNTWLLANGVRINGSLASTSLLKGLAISGISSTALVAPIVVAIKELVEKMNLSELKKKIAEGKEKAKDKKVKKEKKTVGKDKTKKADKMSLDELAKLLKEYRKSGKSLDEFCTENELSEEEKAVIQYLDAKSQENLESSKKGRR